MSFTTTTTTMEGATLSRSGNCEGGAFLSSRFDSSKEGATNRFAAAQKLFKDQARTSSPLSPSSTSSLSRTRSRTNTNPSLYDRLDSGADLSPEEREAYMKTRRKDVPKAAPAAQLATSTEPMTPVNEGCILLGPRRTLQPLDVTRQITARTTSGSPAWYCRHDKLVIFDGYQLSSGGSGALRMVTRSSRGLDMARRNCPKTLIQVDIPCTHCQDLLKRKTWAFEERMLECRVCKWCQERCAVEWEKMQDRTRVEDELVQLEARAKVIEAELQGLTDCVGAAASASAVIAPAMTAVTGHRTIPASKIAKAGEAEVLMVEADEPEYSVLEPYDVTTGPKPRPVAENKDPADTAKRDSVLQDNELSES